MTETATTTVPSEIPAAEPPVVSYIEGVSFKEGWKDALVPEDMRDANIFRELSNKEDLTVPDVFKMLGNMEKLVGKKGVILPTDKSTPSEIDAFYKALGRPDNPEGYKLEYPQDLAQSLPEDPELKKAFLEHSFKTGKTQKQIEADYAFYNEIRRQELIIQAKQQEQEKAEAEAKLKSDPEVDYDSYLHWGDRLISENTQEGEERDKLLEKYGNDPNLIKFLGRIGKGLFAEGKGIPSTTEKSTGMTPSEAKTRMDEIAAQLADKTLVYSNKGLHQRLTNEMAGLAKLIAPK